MLLEISKAFEDVELRPIWCDTFSGMWKPDKRCLQDQQEGNNKGIVQTQTTN